MMLYTESVRLNKTGNVKLLTDICSILGREPREKSLRAGVEYHSAPKKEGGPTIFPTQYQEMNPLLQHKPVPSTPINLQNATSPPIDLDIPQGKQIEFITKETIKITEEKEIVANINITPLKNNEYPLEIEKIEEKKKVIVNFDDTPLPALVKYIFIFRILYKYLVKYQKIQRKKHYQLHPQYKYRGRNVRKKEVKKYVVKAASKMEIYWEQKNQGEKAGIYWESARHQKKKRRMEK